ncbi:MAG TPA: DNA-binding protein [Candidatus Omnitrophica bacterium]|nr:DNA-binding protein [Candidatus Omnitrophota bacterium]
MIKKAQLVIFFLFLAFCFARTNNCFADELSSGELIKNAKEYDGKTVSYEGELIGESLKRKEGTWLNIHDGGDALGVWVPVKVAINIHYAGGYKATGDRLYVTGKFHRSCSMHGGDLDMHAHKIITKEIGRVRPHGVSSYKQDLLKYLSGALLCLLVIFLILQKRQKLI